MPSETICGNNEDAGKGGLRLLDRSHRRQTAMRRKTVFLFDVDNTLLDNDRVTADLRGHLEREVGHECQEGYWSIFEELRAEVGYADYLGALQRYRANYPHDLHVLTVSHHLFDVAVRELKTTIRAATLSLGVQRLGLHLQGPYI